MSDPTTSFPTAQYEMAFRMQTSVLETITIAALLTDLEQRGMLEETLVVWGGEFGRTSMQETTAPKTPCTSATSTPPCSNSSA